MRFIIKQADRKTPCYNNGIPIMGCFTFGTY